MLKNLILSFIVLAGFSGCLKKGEQSCNYDPCAFKAPASEIQAVQDYLDAEGITGATQHCSGLFYIIDDAGSGKQPEACSYVTTNYTGYFTDGSVFDQGTFSTYLTGVIRGWANGVPLIKEGGKIRLFIPPSLGYGPDDYSSIPGNSILIFDVELTKVY